MRYRNRRRYHKKKRQQEAMTPTFFKNPVMGQSFPDRLRMRMVYEEVFNSVGPGIIYVDNIFRGNSVYQCEFGGLGGKAYQFDEITRNYSTFAVFGSSIRADLMNTSSTISGVVTIFPSSDVSSAISMDDAQSQPWAKYARASSIAQRLAAIQRHYAATSTMFGIPKILIKTSDYIGSSIKDPNQQWYWHVCIGSVDGLTALTYTLRIRIVYYVEWYDKYRSRP